ncbi:Uncharacterized protein dnm_017350 [Desulfonema magnum]|uniref:Uncharacterized protein n=1 Tax=Desulfonema magnum TaxID=45655 RepID=A0A975GLD2_9BACT|nr:Uncharacterized protein dnm_017350 [Desulfonema magnum]
MKNEETRVFLRRRERHTGKTRVSYRVNIEKFMVRYLTFWISGAAYAAPENAGDTDLRYYGNLQLLREKK